MITTAASSVTKSSVATPSFGVDDTVSIVLSSISTASSLVAVATHCRVPHDCYRLRRPDRHYYHSLYGHRRFFSFRQSLHQHWLLPHLLLPSVLPLIDGYWLLPLLLLRSILPSTLLRRLLLPSVFPSPLLPLVVVRMSRPSPSPPPDSSGRHHRQFRHLR